MTNTVARHASFWLQPRWALLWCLLLPFLVFSKSLTNDYVYDGQSILVGRLAGQPLGVLVDPSRYSEGAAIMSWRPLGNAVLMVVDDRLFGLRAPLSKALNLLLHGMNGWLVYLLARRLFKTKKEGADALAAIGALSFLVHPLVTETVLVVGFRYDIQALLFSLLAINAALHWKDQPGLALPLTGVSFLLGLMSKEVAVICLPLIPLAIWLDTGNKKRAAVYAGYLFLLFVVFAAVWKEFQYSDYATEYMGGGGRALGMLNFAIVFVTIYLRKFLFPWPLRVDYAYEPVTSFSLLGSIPWLAVILILLIAAILLSRRSTLILFGTLWIVFALAPVSQVLPIPDPVAERFLYVPMVGAALLLCGALGLLWRSQTRKVLYSICTIVLLIWAGLSFRRTFDYDNDIDLNLANWTQANDNRPIALEASGGLYLTKSMQAFEEGDPDSAGEYLSQARKSLEQLLEIEPDNVAANRLMAVTMLASNDPEAALPYATKAAELAPDDPLVANTLSSVTQALPER